jgi:FkbM family methyltransferase
MRITARDLYNRINSSPIYRRFSLPVSAPNGAIVAFYDEDHFQRAKHVLEGHQTAPMVTLLETGLKAEELSARLGMKALGFDFAIRLVHKEFVVCAHDAPRPAVMAMIMKLWRSGREQYCISQPPERKPKPFFVEERKDEILEIANHLSDEESIDHFTARLKAIVMGDAGYLRMSRYWQYAHPFVQAETGDVVCDGGVGTTPTTPINFSNSVGESGFVYGFEPIRASYDQLKAKTADYANIEMVPKGLWSEEKKIEMFVAGDVSTFRKLFYINRNKTETCDLTTIDLFFENVKKAPSFVKLDVEGAEQKALAGAENTIRNNRPKLQVCLYHSDDDFLKIPLQILRYYSKYEIFIGHHTPYFNECVLYASAAFE